jgi:hypothetical protein
VSHVTTSILNDTKKALGIVTSDTVFDSQILMHINAVLSVVAQVGVGPSTGVLVEDDTAVWGDVLEGNNELNMVKSYVYMRVRQMFDPPATSFHVEALNKMILEFEVRMNIVREATLWTDPTVEV